MQVQSMGKRMMILESWLVTCYCTEGHGGQLEFQSSLT